LDAQNTATAPRLRLWIGGDGIHLIAQGVRAVDLPAPTVHAVQRKGYRVEDVPEVHEQRAHGYLGERRGRGEHPHHEEFERAGEDEKSDERTPPPGEARLDDEHHESEAEAKHRGARGQDVAAALPHLLTEGFRRLLHSPRFARST